MLLEKVKTQVIDQCLKELKQSDKLDKIKKNILEPVLCYILSEDYLGLKKYFNKYIIYFYAILYLLIFLIIIMIVLLIKCVMKLNEIHSKLI